MLTALLALTLLAQPLEAHGFDFLDVGRHDIGTFIMPPEFGADERALAEIQSVVSSMQAAVLNGDRDAYLQHVSRTDAHLLAEQTHWADRIPEANASVFGLAIGADPVITPMRAEVDLVMTWQIDGWSGGKLWTVTTPSLFVKEKGEWRYAGEHMEVLQGDGFEVRYPEGFEETARDVAKAFPPARAHADEALGVKDTGYQVVKLYADREQVVASVYLGVPDWIPGWVEPGESMKFVWTYTRGEDWKSALAHEYGHVATFALGPEATNMPWWAAEGIAEVCSDAFKRGYWTYVDLMVRNLAEDGQLRDWDDLANFDATRTDDFNWAYHQGHHLVAFITDEYGPDARNIWLTEMAQGAPLEQASRQAFGVEFDAIDGAWRAHVGDATRPDPALDNEIAAIGATLDAMEQAVLAGDGPGYLRHVSDDDPILHREQINWAADLELHVPTEFELDLTDVDFDGTWAEGELTMTWTMEEIPERDVTYRAGFVQEDGRWLYAGEVWAQVPAQGIIALCMPGLEETGRTAIEVFPDVREHVEEGFGVNVKGVQQIKVYASMRHLQASIYLSYEDPLSGWNEPGEAIKILSRRRASAGGLRNLLAHEYGHVATFKMGEKSTEMPWWVLEGVAELAAERFAGDRGRVDNQVRAWAASDDLADWDQISDFRNTPDHLMWHVYKQGQHFVGYLSEKYGRAKRNQWLTLMAKGATIDEASQQVYAEPFESLDKAWRASLEDG